MSEFKEYRRKSVSELCPWEEGMVIDHVSISREDVAAGSPKEGDMIARNPKNHNDQWLVAGQYFKDNLEPLVEENWYARLLIECAELKVKLKDLTTALDEGNVPDAAREILTKQQKAMKDYADILDIRLKTQ